MQTLAFQIVINAGFLLSVFIALLLSWGLLLVFIRGVGRCGNGLTPVSSSEVVKREGPLAQRNR